MQTNVSGSGHSAGFSLLVDYCLHNNIKCSFYSEPLLCSLGVVPFVSSILIGILTLCGTLFTTGTIDKVYYYIIMISLPDS